MTGHERLLYDCAPRELGHPTPRAGFPPKVAGTTTAGRFAAAIPTEDELAADAERPR